MKSVLACCLLSFLAQPVSAEPLSVDQPRPKNIEICISEYQVKLKTGDVALGLSAPMAVRLTHEIVSGVGGSNQPTVVPCGAIDEAQAFVENENTTWPNGISVLSGEYILYNTKWAHQVIGEDSDLAVVVLGHEVGHLVNGDFSPTRVGTSLIEREKEADRFAGCAAARHAIPWAKVAFILSRLREDYDSDHPKKADSLSEAQAGYNSCLVAIPVQNSNANSGAVAATVSDRPPPTRDLDWNAEKILIKELSSANISASSTVVSYTDGVPETYNMAQKLVEIFARAGLNSSAGQQKTLSYTETGLIILRWPDSDRTILETVRSALSKGGLVSRFVDREGTSPIGPRGVMLWVAPQPL